MSTNSRPQVALLVTDLDNTLWDWFAAWHAGFAPMLELLARRSGVAQEQLEREIREVHQRRNTSEYSYLLNELPSLRQLHGDDVDLMAEYDDVMHVLYSGRKHNTKLYEGVLGTLHGIRAKGVPVVAYTESIAHWTARRVRDVGLDGVLNVLYSSPDHDWPTGIGPKDVRYYASDDAYGLSATEHREVPRGVTKPNSDILTTILEDYKVEPTQAVYVGDSLTKDILMGQAAGVNDAWAAYGVSDGRREYELLRRVSHWPNDVIQRESDTADGQLVVRPSHTLESFGDLLELFDFRPTNDLG
jgi:FMN phosphatase YigB (HAD superfamily)